ncbi:hypothetical protein M569_05395 [Genlisea aurea]|uniref:Uncharacterized protein n=1 Tax=Genlisea aurea TaxID=192259 RepID=S8CRH3_9LAMI|nr:hypothetical protein M569_05395 [Genlisea aurea]
MSVQQLLRNAWASSPNSTSTQKSLLSRFANMPVTRRLSSSKRNEQGALKKLKSAMLYPWGGGKGPRIPL